VAVFDNDGTLWCEKPMPVQLDFILRRLVEMAQQDEGLRGRRPARRSMSGADRGAAKGRHSYSETGQSLNLALRVSHMTNDDRTRMSQPSVSVDDLLSVKRRATDAVAVEVGGGTGPEL
jgi:hypothetical protein